MNQTYEYVLEGDDPEIASNAIVVVDQGTQWSRSSSRPGSAAASPAPVIGLRISGVVKAIITAAAPVYAPRPPRASPPPPPLYADSAPRVVRRPPPALLVQRPRTWSSNARALGCQLATGLCLSLFSATTGAFGDFLTLPDKQTRPHLGSQRPRHRSIAE